MSSGGASFEQHANKRRRPPAGPQRLTLSVQDADDAAAAVVPPVTVVLDGRCICHRVHLNRHTGYRSLAGTLRRMFVDSDDDDSDVHNHHHQQQQQQRGEDDLDLDLANAVPGHVVAYEDMEDDLLLAGDLKWNSIYSLDGVHDCIAAILFASPKGSGSSLPRRRRRRQAAPRNAEEEMSTTATSRRRPAGPG
ncbi:uncharacterized protein [Zea mays]|uniref:Auxin-responsive protein n=1 Tax=Zea mays TaxID=4577 RepID=A0A804RNH3_MAIZE|nr:uncharacterized protein LOC103642136 isoform X1 [Zea mays]|eukprot:XP_008663666.1 uncharacterized protein LOC103642136 isoform X1 [Zea mays]